jgi:hypothetical protein
MQDLCCACGRILCLFVSVIIVAAIRNSDIREPPWEGFPPSSCCYVGRQEPPPRSLVLLGAAALWREGNPHPCLAKAECCWGWGTPMAPTLVLLPSRALSSVLDILGHSGASLDPHGLAWGYLGAPSGSFCSNYAGSFVAFWIGPSHYRVFSIGLLCGSPWVLFTVFHWSPLRFPFVTYAVGHWLLFWSSTGPPLRSSIGPFAVSH